MPFILALILLAAPEPAQKTPVEAPPASTVEATLKAAFEAALAKDFKAYAATVHPDKKSSSNAVKAIERYEWPRFQKHAEWYLVAKKPVTFEILRRRDAGPDQTRVFLKDQKNKDRMPIPVRLKRHQGVWMITANSL